MIYIRVAIDSHSEAEAKKFEEEVTALEDVVACYSIGGDADFLLQVVAYDLDYYADFAMSVIRRLPGIKEMQSMFVLKEIKPLVTYPIKKLSGQAIAPWGGMNRPANLPERNVPMTHTIPGIHRC